MENISDIMTLARKDRTSHTPDLVTQDSSSNTPDFVTQDSTSDTPELVTQDDTSRTPELVTHYDTSDTLTLARKDRESQGPWEFEYSYGGEADLHRHFARCKKNPGHKNFIPVDKFSIEDLPEDYRDKDIFSYIRAVSDLTVRVKVECVSDKRPDCSNIDRQRVTVGTGVLSSVDMYNELVIPDTCKCKTCKNSLVPEKIFAIINIYTAAHVVFDDLEAEHTTCHLFFDRGGIPNTCSGVVAMNGMSRVVGDHYEDHCRLEYHTHDLDLANSLEQKLQQMHGLQFIVRSKMPRILKFKQRLGVLDRQPLLFLVSHPHGCSKQISIGGFIAAEMIYSNIISLLYNTATCPGSSGAKMGILAESAVINSVSMPSKKLLLMSCLRVHCGASDALLGVNYSRVLEVDSPTFWVSVKLRQKNKGPWEDNFCSVEEGDENQHYAACMKNPGHENFFPVDKFSMNDLPLFYRTEDVMKLVKLMSALTVRLSVKYVSENRPETVPGTNIPYPWSGSKGSHLTRLGTGRIEGTGICTSEKCSCKECIISTEPNLQYGLIQIRTAANLVYDQLEADHTTCHLFCDSGETPDICTNVITLTDVHTFKNLNQSDACTITFHTHDLDLVLRLRNMTFQYSDIFDNVKKSVNENSADYIKQEHPLNIVVSHPHGCAKQISVCCCGNENPGNADTEDSQCSHASILCPGSSGAPLVDLSWKLVYPFIE